MDPLTKEVTLQGIDLDVMSDPYLTSLRECTGSEISFFGTIWENYLDIRQISTSVWAQDSSIAHERMLGKFRELTDATLFGRAVLQNRIISADRVENLPHHHNPVGPFVAIPIRNEDGSVCGLLALGGSKDGYGNIETRLGEVDIEAKFRCTTSLCRMVFLTQVHKIELARRTQELAVERVKTQSAAVAMANLDSVMKDKMMYFAAMSHELRTPLHAIVGVTDLLGDMRLSPEAMEMVGTLSGSCSLAMHVISNVLEYNKIATGHMIVSMATVSSTDMLGNLHRMVQGICSGKGIQFIIAHTRPYMPSIVKTDCRAFEQIAMNVVSNAIKFGATEIIMKISYDPVAYNAIVTISDNGPGVATSLAVKLFEPYVQSDLSRSKGGAGLGLTICKQLAKSLSGDIVLLPTDIGASFQLSFQMLPDVHAHREEMRLGSLAFHQNMCLHGTPTKAEEAVLDVIARSGLKILVDSCAHNICVVAGSSEHKEGLRLSAIKAGTHPVDLLKDIKRFAALARRSSVPKIETIALMSLETRAHYASSEQITISPTMEGTGIVLLCDDNKLNRTIMAMNARKYAQKEDIIDFDDGAPLVAYIRDRPWLLLDRRVSHVLLDYHMTEMSGIAAAEALLEMCSQLDVQPPALWLITGDAVDSVEQECARLGMNVLYKPVTKDQYARIFV